jgi:hypothetical protein
MKSRRMRWARHVAFMEEMRNAYKFFVGRPEGKRPLGRPRQRWEDVLQLVLGKQGGQVWTRYIWLRIGTSSGL